MAMFSVYWDTNFEEEEDEEDYTKYMNPPLPDELIKNGIVLNSEILSESDQKSLLVESSLGRERKKHKKSKKSCRKHKGKHTSPNRKSKKGLENSVVINMPCDTFIDCASKREKKETKIEKLPKEYPQSNVYIDTYPEKEHKVKVKVELGINDEHASSNARKEHKIKTEPIDDDHFSTKNLNCSNEKKSCSKRIEPINNDHTSNVNEKTFQSNIIIKREPETTDHDTPMNISHTSNKRSHIDSFADSPTNESPVSGKKPRLEFPADIVIKQEAIDDNAKIAPNKLYERSPKLEICKSKDSNYIGTITDDRESNAIHGRSTTLDVYESSDHFPNRVVSSKFRHSDGLSVSSVKSEPEDDIKKSQSVKAMISPNELKLESANGPKKEPLNVLKAEPLNLPKAEAFSSIKESNIKIQAPCVPTSIDSVCDMIDFPCVGLDYVFEIPRPSLMHDIVFRCELCNAKCGQKTILAHLKSFKHYLFCLKKYRPLIYENFKYEKKAKISRSVEVCIMDLEKEIGRGKMSIKPNRTIVPQSSSDSSSERSPSHSPGLNNSFAKKSSTYHVSSYEDFRTCSPKPSSSSFSKNSCNYPSSYKEFQNHSPRPENFGFVNRANSYQPSHVNHNSKLVSYEEETSSNSPKPETSTDSDKKSSSYHEPTHRDVHNKPSFENSPSYSSKLESSDKKLSSSHLQTHQVKHDSKLVSYEASPSSSPSHEISARPAKIPSSNHAPSHGNHEVKSLSSKHHASPAVNFKSLSPKLVDSTYSHQSRPQVITQVPRLYESHQQESLPAQPDVTTRRFCHLYGYKRSASPTWSREVRSQPVETRREVKSIRIKDSTPLCHISGDIPDRSMGDYYCRVCDSHMSSDQIWESHIVGKRHRKNVKKPPGEKPSKVKSQKRVDIAPLLLEELEGVEDAIVGLKHISEIIKTDQEVGPTYACYLCSGSFTRMNIISHLISTRHRLQYMQEVDPDSYKLTNEVHFSKSALDSFVENKALELECKYGRGNIEVRTEIIKD